MELEGCFQHYKEKGEIIYNRTKGRKKGKAQYSVGRIILLLVASSQKWLSDVLRDANLHAVTIVLPYRLL